LTAIDKEQLGRYMLKTATRILKSENIKLEGRFQLDIGQTESDLPKRTIPASSPPQARMSENHPDYAVIEVTCSCGTTISIRCEYAEAQASAPNGGKT
jgi:hypothetical protein